MTAPIHDRPASITRPNVTSAGPPAVPPTIVQIRDALREEVRAALYPTLAEARKLVNEAGIPTARNKLGSALDVLDLSQKELREAQAVERAKQEAFDQAVLDVEWTLDANFVRESNRTYLVEDCSTCGGAGMQRGGPDQSSPCSVCIEGQSRRQVTADEAKAWKAARARKAPEVMAAREALRRATERTYAARDAVALSERRISACTHELDAAVGVLAILTAGLSAGDGRGA